MKKYLVVVGALLGMVEVAAAQTPSGSIYTHRYNHLPQGQYSQYVDFSTTSSVAGHFSFATFSSPDGTGDVKFIDIQNYQTGSAGRCLRYTTSTPVSHEEADVKLWANVSNTANRPDWRKLSDDTQGTRLPIAFVWIKGYNTEQPVRLRLAAYSPYTNTGAYWLTVFDQGDTAQDRCGDSSNGLLRVIDGRATVVRTGN